MAPAVSAQKPPNGVSFVMRCPIVLTMRHPPAIVPRPIAACAARMTQIGILLASVRWNAWIGKFTKSDWLDTSSATMMPIVFCASFVPWPREYAAADTSCSTRNVLSTLRGSDRRRIQESATVINSASVKPITGATTMKISVFVHPLAMTAEHYRRIDDAEVDQSFPDRLRDGGAEDERRDEVPERRPHHRCARRQDTRRNDGGDGVGRVVEPIDEIEREGDEQNRQNEPDGAGAGHQACLIVMDSTTFATSSAWSRVPSRLS